MKEVPVRGVIPPKNGTFIEGSRSRVSCYRLSGTIANTHGTSSEIDSAERLQLDSKLRIRRFVVIVGIGAFLISSELLVFRSLNHSLEGFADGLGTLFQRATVVVDLVSAASKLTPHPHQGQTIPEQIWGKWVVTRQIPTTTISCWGAAEEKTLLGTEIEYSAEVFRWKDVVTTQPVAESRTVSAEQFHDDNSSKGSNSSQITFRQLGIKAKQAMIISIHHPPAEITGGTIEIPGDEVLVKNKGTIVFAACNLYFEANRVPATSSAR
jgi:hypothetical protein